MSNSIAPIHMVSPFVGTFPASVCSRIRGRANRPFRHAYYRGALERLEVCMGAVSARNLGAVVLAVTIGSMLGSCSAAPAVPDVSAPSAPEHPTLHTLAEMELGSTALELGEQVEKNEAFTTTAVTYDSGEETVTGALSVPTSDGPHPAIVLVHGVVDPDVYQPGKIGRASCRERGA